MKKKNQNLKEILIIDKEDDRKTLKKKKILLNFI